MLWSQTVLNPTNLMHTSTLHPAETEARAIFARVLSQWTMDTLKLRALGLHEPTARPGDGGIVLPAWPGQDGASAYDAPCRMPRMQMRSALSWRPAPIRKAA